MDPAPKDITRLVGIYHANGTVIGEVAYWLKARVGIGHCALCDITHGTFREKDSWRRCRTDVPVQVETMHLDERSPDLRSFTDGHTPCVVAETPTGFVMLVSPMDLAACIGSPQCLVDTITSRAAELHLRLA